MFVVRIITILSNHSVVVELRITKTLVEPDIEMIKANATLTDGSILYDSEIIGNDWRDYSYHWHTILKWPKSGMTMNWRIRKPWLFLRLTGSLLLISGIFKYYA